ncbi:hypothetical protein SCRM01_267 [Synechococcus phage S-CRM01]|uniref:hypothetical protein n=1 Tax=Synechococcus phage S-CRM01 TaxID=1026955 RepID=UPI000209E307|nr:hypothetical protein SCRM01_267 [Synechococcus phage S-CRM01]AEC53213.1 hypothetical protein SCRM01_267 [Synechococcus phage S-CRM01]
MTEIRRLIQYVDERIDHVSDMINSAADNETLRLLQEDRNCLYQALDHLLDIEDHYS